MRAFVTSKIAALGLDNYLHSVCRGLGCYERSPTVATLLRETAKQASGGALRPCRGAGHNTAPHKIGGAPLTFVDVLAAGSATPGKRQLYHVCKARVEAGVV